MVLCCGLLWNFKVRSKQKSFAIERTCLGCPRRQSPTSTVGPAERVNCGKGVSAILLSVDRRSDGGIRGDDEVGVEVFCLSLS